MIRTIIVDDDFLVRSYLKQLSAWEKAEYEIIGDYRDGEEALTAVETLGPDLLITDISMPVMNGIELIRNIRRQNHGIYIMVLSCHDDFEYVKEAMQLGADEYVLKNSLNEDNLFDILDKTKHQMKNRREENRESDDAKHLMEMGRHTLKYHFFNGLLAGTFSPEEKEKKRLAAGIQVNYKNSAVINMCVPSWGALKESLTELELEQYSQRFLQKMLLNLKGREEDAAYVECVYLGEGVFCCFLDLSELRRSSMMKQRLTGVATACFRCCKEEEYPFEVGVSNICFGEEGIRQAYQQAREMIKFSFYEEGSILYYEGSCEIGRILPKEAEQLLKEADDLVEGQQYEPLKKSMEQLIEVCRKGHIDSRLVLHWLKTLDQKFKIERTQEEYGGIVKIEQLMDICEEYHQKLFMEKQKNIPKSVGAPVRKVIEYLHIHYKEQIGLGEAAETVNLNSAYLSYLFKQELGCGFSNYLLELRIECARVLLRSTNDKIKDVSAQSGFQDYHYFSKAFKKLNGTSPAEYRKENSKI
ncbi:MAG: response regulator [Lachnospiraceae bacterium]